MIELRKTAPHFATWYAMCKLLLKNGRPFKTRIIVVNGTAYATDAYNLVSIKDQEILPDNGAYLPIKITKSLIQIMPDEPIDPPDFETMFAADKIIEIPEEPRYPEMLAFYISKHIDKPIVHVGAVLMFDAYDHAESTVYDGDGFVSVDSGDIRVTVMPGLLPE